MRDMPPEEFIGEAIILDASNRKDKLYVQVEDIEPLYARKIRREDIVLVYTGWGPKRDYSTEWLKDYPSLTTDCAKWIMKHKPKGFGIDAISLDSFHGPKTTTKEGLKPAPEGESNHRIIIAGDIWGIEELYLPKQALQKERWWFSALRSFECCLQSMAHCRLVVGAAGYCRGLETRAIVAFEHSGDQSCNGMVAKVGRQIAHMNSIVMVSLALPERLAGSGSVARNPRFGALELLVGR